MEIDDIKVDKYGSLIIGTPKLTGNKSKRKNKFSLSFVYPNNDILWYKHEEKRPPYPMRYAFFYYHFKTLENGTQSLTLDGKDLHRRIGRRFMNWDVPYLSLFMQKHHDVTILNLPNNQINSAGFMTLILCIITCNRVLELDLRNNEIDDSGINYLLRNGMKLKLRVLRLSGNKIGVENSKKVALMLARNSDMKRLELAAVDQTETSLVYFTTVLRYDQKHFNNSLTILDLSRPNPQCQIIKFDSSHIAMVIGLMLRFNTSLQELHLQKFGFCCHDIEEMLENAKHNKTLKILDLSCNNIGDYAAELFGGWLRKHPTLRSLLLGHNVITDHGIRLLSRGIKFSKLVAVDVSYNRFTDESGILLLHSLKKLPLIHQLRIYGNKIGHPMAKIVERMLLSDILDQENLDVKPYEVDGIYYFAYYHIIDPDKYKLKIHLCNTNEEHDYFIRRHHLM